MDQTESLVFQRVVGSIASSTSESVGVGLGFGEYDAEVEGVRRSTSYLSVLGCRS